MMWKSIDTVPAGRKVDIWCVNEDLKGARFPNVTYDGVGFYAYDHARDQEVYLNFDGAGVQPSHWCEIPAGPFSVDNSGGKRG